MAVFAQKYIDFAPIFHDIGNSLPVSRTSKYNKFFSDTLQTS